MSERPIAQERVQNLWNSAARKFPPLARSTSLQVAPAVGSEQIGGLAEAQDEVLTYACAMTSPEVYGAWGTFPPSGLLLMGPHGCGKSLLAEALATRAGTAFLRIQVPRLALELVHHGGKVSELMEAWSNVIGDMSPLTVFFHELEFMQAAEIGGDRMDLPFGPIMDFLCDLVDHVVAHDDTLLVGSTSHPDSLRPAFALPGRFERVVEVSPSHPDDIVAALRIHARAAEKRAGRALFGEVDWLDVVNRFREPSTGEWVGVLHATLRRKALSECAALEPGQVTTQDLVAQVEVLRRTLKHLRSTESGTYL